MKRRCKHYDLAMITEKDRCWWVMCTHCGAEGPAKNTQPLALVAFALKIADQHPRGCGGLSKMGAARAKKILKRINRQ